MRTDFQFFREKNEIIIRRDGWNIKAPLNTLNFISLRDDDECKLYFLSFARLFSPHPLNNIFTSSVKARSTSFETTTSALHHDEMETLIFIANFPLHHHPFPLCLHTNSLIIWWPAAAMWCVVDVDGGEEKKRPASKKISILNAISCLYRKLSWTLLAGWLDDWMKLHEKNNISSKLVRSCGWWCSHHNTQRISK